MNLPEIKKERRTSKVPLTVRMATPVGVSLMVLSLLGSLLFLISGDPASAAWSLLYFAFLAWYLTGLMFVSNIGIVLLEEKGNPNQFRLESTVRRSINILERLPVYKRHCREPIKSALAYTHALKGEYEEAEELFRSITDSLRGNKRQRFPYYALDTYNLALTLKKQSADRYDEALAVAEEALAICEDQKPVFRMACVFPLNLIAEIWMERGDLVKAKDYLLRGWTLLETASRKHNLFGPEKEIQLRLDNRLSFAVLLIRGGDVEKADELFPYIMELLTTLSTGLSPSSISEVLLLADEYRKLGDTEKAERLLTVLYDFGRLIPDHPDCRSILACYESLLIDSERKDDVENMKKWLLPTDPA